MTVQSRGKSIALQRGVKPERGVQHRAESRTGPQSNASLQPSLPPFPGFAAVSNSKRETSDVEARSVAPKTALDTQQREHVACWSSLGRPWGWQPVRGGLLPLIQALAEVLDTAATAGADMGQDTTAAGTGAEVSTEEIDAITRP